RFTTTVTNPRGFQSVTYTNLLGQAIEIDAQGCGGYCVTKSVTDAAGRLRSITDPGNNTAYFDYDGVGRKTQMRDPDMGTWNYSYDLVGNLTQQVDAKNQIITITYDTLNRPYLK